MNDPLYANLFFITATVFMSLLLIISVLLLVYVISVIDLFKDILNSLKKTTSHVEEVSSDFLDKFQEHSEKFSGFLGVIHTLLVGKKEPKKVKSVTSKKETTKKK